MLISNTHKAVMAAAVLLVVSSMLLSTTLQAQTLNLVGNKVATYIDEHKLPARQMDVVAAALGDKKAQIIATTQAWSGSGLRSGKFAGYIDHYSLNDQKDDYLYSLPYMQVELHVVSRNQKAESIIRLEQLYRERVGVENRFANTDQLRDERDIRWARSPWFFDNIKQLSERRVDFLLVDKAMLDEMNLLLKSVGQKPIYVSKVSLISVNVSLAIHRDYADAKDIIASFEKGIEALKSSGEYAELLKQDLNRESLLDDRVYSDILEKW
ncbi:substrate-binding periplasmic protein [Brumicola nitratireducens]|uniref:Uncharacterized protein n=1 Tax=Glaciecola nitratireducens (strain JCM 12485 / KCTC 12276 / FR1064) TaxID=1085623 RepID=G4QEM9_GLANF|nr:transporter substrate-binding domain-containing protein [Glaciecola nitratireducens]AEP28792.1 hypothetical protein GNIT_0639 [Glaciecola nitratireducens FR1064]